MAGQENFPAFAAIDLGTNNCRLIVARPVALPVRPHQGIKVIDTFSRIVRLGENLGEHNTLSTEAMNRTLTALKACRKKVERYGIEYGRYIATEACRRADNTEEFLERVKAETGFDIEVISTEQEAKLAFLGCSSLLLPESENGLVFDIGGGSTEFMWVRRDDMAPPEQLFHHRFIDWLSLDKGVMNLSEKFGGAAFAEMYFEELVMHLVSALRMFDRKNKISEAIAEGRVQMLSTSGTLTTLAAIHLGLVHYERSKIDGVTFEISDLRGACRKILAMRPSERFSNLCIGPDRSDYIISGCAIFEAICTLWEVSKVTIADRGVREGVILSLMQQYNRDQMDV